MSPQSFYSQDQEDLPRVRLARGPPIQEGLTFGEPGETGSDGGDSAAPQSEGKSWSGALEAVYYPIQRGISFHRRESAEKKKDTANRSVLISEAADDVFEYDRLTKMPASSKAVVHTTGNGDPWLLQPISRASQSIHRLRRCDPHCDSLCELLEDNNGKYRMTPGTAKAVTQSLARYRVWEQMDDWDSVCRRAEAGKRSKNAEGFVGGRIIEDEQE